MSKDRDYTTEDAYNTLSECEGNLPFFDAIVEQYRRDWAAYQSSEIDEIKLKDTNSQAISALHLGYELSENLNELIDHVDQISEHRTVDGETLNQKKVHNRAEELKDKYDEILSDGWSIAVELQSSDGNIEPVTESIHEKRVRSPTRTRKSFQHEMREAVSSFDGVKKSDIIEFMFSDN